LAERLLVLSSRAKGQHEKITCEYFYEENPNYKLIFLLHENIKTIFLFEVRWMRIRFQILEHARCRKVRGNDYSRFRGKFGGINFPHIPSKTEFFLSYSAGGILHTGCQC